MLNLYTEKDLLTEKNRSHVFPLLFDLVYVKDTGFSDYYQLQNDFKNADIGVWPLEYGYSMLKFKEKLDQFLTEADSTKKFIWIYSGGDYGYSIGQNNIYNFRLGGFKSKLKEQDVMLPSFIRDPYDSVIKEKFKVLAKQDKPKIGFVGHASRGFVKYLMELWHYSEISLKKLFKIIYADFQPFYPSGIKRYKFLRKLMANCKIQDNFILRKQYRAGVKTEEQRIRTTDEFYQNIFESPYTFCMRGNGNFSVRFFETLAVGRIPLFLNTDCKLPFNDLIDWKKHVVWVEQGDATNLDATLNEFHDSISDKDFRSMQLNNRKLWQDILTRYGYFKHIHDIFKKKLI